MNILFLTMSSKMADLKQSGIYTDLMRKFREEGYEVYIVAPYERRTGKPTRVTEADGVHFMGVRTLNVTKTNVVEKGVGQLLMEYQFCSAIRTHWGHIDFDIVLYSTPPITFTRVVRDAKKRNPKSLAYLLLKDIFPQNAVDLRMLSKSGPKGLLYRKFRRQEKQMYAVSDYIGCMSPANVEYVRKHNPEVDPAKVEIAPNSYCAAEQTPLSAAERDAIRTRLGLPTGKPILIYGGNLGKPQGIPFLIECLEACKERTDCHFVVIGGGTEYPKLQAWMEQSKPKNASLFSSLPKADYDQLARACDAGLIFLDYRFSIPNYPSRLLPYLMEKKPIIACTDPNCDTGKIAEQNGYGFYCPSNSTEAFCSTVDRLLSSDMTAMGERGYRFYLDNYTVQNTYDAIVQHLKR